MLVPMFVAGHHRELHHQDPGGIHTATEGVARFVETKILAGEDVRGSVSSRMIQTKISQLEGNLERSSCCPLVEEGHGNGGLVAGDGHHWPGKHVNVLTSNDSLGLNSKWVLKYHKVHFR